MSFIKNFLKKTADKAMNLLTGDQYDIDTPLEKPKLLKQPDAASKGKYDWPYEFVDYVEGKLPYEFKPRYKVLPPFDETDDEDSTSESEPSSRCEAGGDWRPKWWVDFGDERVLAFAAGTVLLSGVFTLSAISLRRVLLNR